MGEISKNPEKEKEKPEKENFDEKAKKSFWSHLIQKEKENTINPLALITKNQEKDSKENVPPTKEEMLDKLFREPMKDEAGDIAWKAFPEKSEEIGEGKKDADATDDSSKKDILEQNRINGAKREEEVKKELEEKYKTEDGYEIRREQYLRDKDGNIQKDHETGEARRLDFVVLKDGKVVDSIEVTSNTADKTKQLAKEDRVREEGGNFIKDSKGDLVEMPAEIRTRLERRAFA